MLELLGDGNRRERGHPGRSGLAGCLRSQAGRRQRFSGSVLAIEAGELAVAYLLNLLGIWVSVALQYNLPLPRLILRTAFGGWFSTRRILRWEYRRQFF